MKLILTHDDGEVIDSLDDVTFPEIFDARRNPQAAQFLLAQLRVPKDDYFKTRREANQKIMSERLDTGSEVG